MEIIKRALQMVMIPFSERDVCLQTLLENIQEAEEISEIEKNIILADHVLPSYLRQQYPRQAAFLADLAVRANKEGLVGISEKGWKANIDELHLALS